MTAQAPERFDSQHGDFVQQPPANHAFTIRGVPGTWYLHGVIRGVPAIDNHGWGTGKAYKADPGKPRAFDSANWKGYAELFQLTAAGRLVLLGFKYDYEPERQHLVNETLEGDFFMVLKQSFFAPRLYVPFRDAVLVTDRAAWLCETESVLGSSAGYPGYKVFDLDAAWMPTWLAYRS